MSSPNTEMDALQQDDVPCGDDWGSAAVVAGWARAADQKRPWRSQIRDHIAGIVAMLIIDVATPWSNHRPRWGPDGDS